MKRRTRTWTSMTMMMMTKTVVLAKGMSPIGVETITAGEAEDPEEAGGPLVIAGTRTGDPDGETARGRRIRVVAMEVGVQIGKMMMDIMDGGCELSWMRRNGSRSCSEWPNGVSIRSRTEDVARPDQRGERKTMTVLGFSVHTPRGSIGTGSTATAVLETALVGVVTSRSVGNAAKGDSPRTFVLDAQDLVGFAALSASTSIGPEDHVQHYVLLSMRLSEVGETYGWTRMALSLSPHLLHRFLHRLSHLHLWTKWIVMDSGDEGGVQFRGVRWRRICREVIFC